MRRKGLRNAAEFPEALEAALGSERAVLIHHLAHLQVLLQHLIHLLDGGAAAAGDALAPFAVDEVVIVAFGVGHRIDDGLDALQVRFVDLHVLGTIRQRTYFRQHSEHLLVRAHLADLPQLVAEILEREFAAAQFALEFGHLLGVNGLLDALDQ